jgi:hypothetical protein
MGNIASVRFAAKTAGFAFMVAMSGTVLAGQVKGKVLGAEKLINPVWSEAKETSAHRFNWREPSPTVRADIRNSLSAFAPKEVCIAAIASTSQQPPALPIDVTIGGGRTTPVTMVVPNGARLRFTNRDPFPHKPYVVGQSSFPPGEMASVGATRDWSAPGPGKYELRDEMSPSVRSWIVVEANVAATTYPTKDRDFAFPQLPPGDYTIRAYFAGAPTGTPRTVNVGATGTVDLKDGLAVVEGADKANAKGKK